MLILKSEALHLETESLSIVVWQTGCHERQLNRIFQSIARLTWTKEVIGLLRLTRAN
jgi:hypothetical protein